MTRLVNGLRMVARCMVPKCDDMDLVGMFKKVYQTAFLVQLNFQSIRKENIKLRDS